jgi:hypothetical protein
VAALTIFRLFIFGASRPLAISEDEQEDPGEFLKKLEIF